MLTILVADDEPDVVEVIQLGLRLNSPDWDVVSAEDGRAALDTFHRINPDLVILDVNMPQMNGLDVCRAIRAESDVPIIFLTVRDEEIEKVRGLEAGADDYITKPFSPLELLARIRALLRRTARNHTAPLAPGLNGGMGGRSRAIVAHAGLVVDLNAQTVTLNGDGIRLTALEYKLLHYLASNAGQVLSHDFLLTRVWGPEYRRELEYLKVHIRHLREKLGDDAQNPRFIFTERNKGYRFAAISGTNYGGLNLPPLTAAEA